ncbi:unnamed protein product, partial [Prorocentrum cordatum]
MGARFTAWHVLSLEKGAAPGKGDVLRCQGHRRLRRTGRISHLLRCRDAVNAFFSLGRQSVLQVACKVYDGQVDQEFYVDRITRVQAATSTSGPELSELLAELLVNAALSGAEVLGDLQAMRRFIAEKCRAMLGGDSEADAASDSLEHSTITSMNCFRTLYILGLLRTIPLRRVLRQQTPECDCLPADRRYQMAAALSAGTGGGKKAFPSAKFWADYDKIVVSNRKIAIDFFRHKKVSSILDAIGLASQSSEAEELLSTQRYVLESKNRDHRTKDEVREDMMKVLGEIKRVQAALGRGDTPLPYAVLGLPMPHREKREHEEILPAWLQEYADANAELLGVRKVEQKAAAMAAREAQRLAVANSGLKSLEDVRESMQRTYGTVAAATRKTQLSKAFEHTMAKRSEGERRVELKRHMELDFIRRNRRGEAPRRDSGGHHWALPPLRADRQTSSQGPGAPLSRGGAFAAAVAISDLHRDCTSQ